MKWLKLGVFLFVLFIFFYLRLTPIINQTVPYTYDQGRDFLKAEEIIRDKNLTFIGPTTGIQGVYHGVWWYYFLLIPYVLLSGWPQGFYLSLFFLYLIVNLGFFWFLKKNYSPLTAIFFLALVSISTFFIRTSFFVSNNILVPAFILLLIYSLYKLFDRKDTKYLLLIGVSLGFIFETEMAFGFFIIPAFLVNSLFFKDTRILIKKLKNIFLFITGLFIPVIPRILFELKNNFSQTNSFINYFLSPKTNHPLLFKTLVQERLLLFWQYWRSIFYQENIILAGLFLFFLLVLFFLRKNLTGPKKILKNFLLSLLIFIFIISLSNKINFFWNYYLDGIQYIFVFLIITVFYLLERARKLQIFSYLILFSIIIINLFTLINEVTTKKPIPLIGLKADDTIIKYVLQKSQKKDFCLRIYTPPVFPFTYRYLMDYYIKKEGYKIPSDLPINKRCWYIIDYDEDSERVATWVKNNIPDKSKLIERKFMENKTRIELWSINN